jgi:hypothetical protein
MPIQIQGTTVIDDSRNLTNILNNGVPSGTKMLFVQTAAPTGWTKQTTDNDASLRVVSGSASTGGSVGFTTAFASQAVTGSISGSVGSGSISGSVSGSLSGTTGAYTLSTSEMPSHTHNYNAVGSPPSGSVEFQFISGSKSSSSFTTSSAGGGGSHSHSFSGAISGGSVSGTSTAGAFSGSFSGNAINLAVKYVDSIIATKD